jgi:hypothetical protein
LSARTFSEWLPRSLEAAKRSPLLPVLAARLAETPCCWVKPLEKKAVFALPYLTLSIVLSLSHLTSSQPASRRRTPPPFQRAEISGPTAPAAWRLAPRLAARARGQERRQLVPVDVQLWPQDLALRIRARDLYKLSMRRSRRPARSMGIRILRLSVSARAMSAAIESHSPRLACYSCCNQTQRLPRL